MKLIHLSDLHLGKRVNEFSMMEDQAYILKEILGIIDREQPDGVIIAGDVYDKPVPSGEAVALFDDFLVGLSRRNVQVFVISGNHDSPERIAFGGRLMERSGMHFSPVYSGTVEPVMMEDQWGPVAVWMLPFLKPVHVRRYFPEEEIISYTDGLDIAIKHLDPEGKGIDPSIRNVLVTHQFVTGASRSDSEEISVGGADNVDAAVFHGFDYVALGHIHRPQNIRECRDGRDGEENRNSEENRDSEGNRDGLCSDTDSGGRAAAVIRYCGTPLKYSFSEAGHEKSVTIAELGKKGDIKIRTEALIPRRDLRELRGTYMEVTARSFYEGTATDDYLHITLTDEEDIPDAMGKLRVIYPNLMKLDYDNLRTRSSRQLTLDGDMERKTPLELFGEFYEKQNNQPMSLQQTEFMEQLIEKIWEGEA